ncbi:hypothetical protein [Runella sp. SP2]|uniref:hypothetical protein n=1 Tax=Runella sp. SP2 TaxID=2268026 RepID=UPI000F08C874|nr:hypothetical protein [Runella sp. SP2]AYQ35717.1 hypothetical protein DTQ70_27680 [Runella sp. SP2]
MPRSQNPVHSAYYIGLLTNLYDWAIEGTLYSKPADKNLVEWFTVQIEKSRHLGEVPPPQGAKKAFTTMRSKPAACNFDKRTLDRLCRVLACSLSVSHFSDFSSFVKWAGEVPQGISDESELLKIARTKVERYYQLYTLQNESPRDIVGHGNSLLFSIRQQEEFMFFSDGQLEPWQQANAIQELFYLIKTYPEQFLTAYFLSAFNSIFVYDCSKVMTLSLTKKLYQGAAMMVDYLKSQEAVDEDISRVMLHLVLNVMKAAWAGGEVAITKEFNEELGRLIDKNKLENTLDSTELFRYEAEYYAYRCCFEPSAIDDYVRFTRAVICPDIERKKYIFKALKCTACVALRRDDYESASRVLNQIRQECDVLFEQNRLAKPLKAFYHYLSGRTFYCKGAEFFGEAVAELTMALDIWKSLRLDTRMIEGMHAYSLLMAIEQQQKGEKKDGKKEIPKSLVKVNACSVSLKQIEE